MALLFFGLFPVCFYLKLHPLCGDVSKRWVLMSCLISQH